MGCAVVGLVGLMIGVWLLIKVVVGLWCHDDEDEDDEEEACW